MARWSVRTASSSWPVSFKAAPELFDDGAIDGGMTVAEHDRSDRHRQIDELVAVDVPHAGAFGACQILGRDTVDVLRRTFSERLRTGRNQAPRSLPKRLRSRNAGKILIECDVMRQMRPQPADRM